MQTSTTSTSTDSPEISPRTRVQRYVREMVASGQLAAGDRLPSEQSLTDATGTSRTTVRAALKEMEQAGQVRLVGRRRIVCEPPESKASLASHSIAILDTAVYEDMDGVVPEGFTWRIFSGLTDAAASHHFNTILLQRPAGMRERIEQILADRPAGLVVLHHEFAVDHEMELLFQAAAQSGLPIVCYGSGADVIPGATDSVASDHRLGSYLLTRWLIERGRKRILRFWRLVRETQGQRSWLAQRDEGYVQAMREAGLPVLPAIQYNEPPKGDFDAKEGFDQKVYEARGRLAEYVDVHGPFDAAMASSDGVVNSLAAALRPMGFGPNQDVYLAGYDNFANESKDNRWEPTKPLVTIDKRNALLGRLLLETLLARRAGKLPPEPQRRLLEPLLIELNGTNPV